jgi:hypothetical protein
VRAIGAVPLAVGLEVAMPAAAQAVLLSIGEG